MLQFRAVNGKETILFDKTVTGFGLRILPPGRKAWIVQIRIEVRKSGIVVARLGEMNRPEARRRARFLAFASSRLSIGRCPSEHTEVRLSPPYTSPDAG